MKKSNKLEKSVVNIDRLKSCLMYLDKINSLSLKQIAWVSGGKKIHPIKDEFLDNLDRVDNVTWAKEFILDEEDRRVSEKSLDKSA
jgi:hypothetical protein